MDGEGIEGVFDVDGEQVFPPGPEQQSVSTGETVTRLEILPVTRSGDKALASLETPSD